MSKLYSRAVFLSVSESIRFYSPQQQRFEIIYIMESQTDASILFVGTVGNVPVVEKKNRKSIVKTTKAAIKHANLI